MARNNPHLADLRRPVRDVLHHGIIGMIGVDEDKIQGVIQEMPMRRERALANERDATGEMPLRLHRERAEMIVVRPALVGLGSCRVGTLGLLFPKVNAAHMEFGDERAEIEGGSAGGDAEFNSLGIAVDERQSGEDVPSLDFVRKTFSQPGPFNAPL